MVNSAKFRVNHSNKKQSSIFFIATKIAEDIMMEMDNPNHKRQYKDSFIAFLNEKHKGELKHIICGAFLNISNRSFGYKPLFKFKQSDYQKRLVEIIPLQTCLFSLS